MRHNAWLIALFYSVADLENTISVIVNYSQFRGKINIKERQCKIINRLNYLSIYYQKNINNTIDYNQAHKDALIY